jgi:protein-S-isoprenylcysteine O-methyltransferase Ste14
LRTVVAGGLAVASTTLAGASSYSFRREGTTVLPFHPEQTSSLVTTGVHALTRNPMYVGMAGLLFAQVAYRGSWTALAPAAAFVAAIDVYQVRFEEAALRERFGDVYDAYSRAVPRWLDGRSLRAVGEARSRQRGLKGDVGALSSGGRRGGYSSTREAAARRGGP